LVETPPGCTTDKRTGLAAICSSCRRLSEKPRTANFEAMREWNHATIYRKTIGYFADQLVGR